MTASSCRSSASSMQSAPCGAVGLRGLPLVGYLSWTMARALRAHGLQHDRALAGLLSMLVEDTVQALSRKRPLINAALGVTIRAPACPGARWHPRILATVHGPLRRGLGGILRVGCPVEKIEGRAGDYHLTTRRGGSRPVR